MAELDIGYTSLDEAPEREVFEPVPKGRYGLQAIELDIVPTNDQTGRRMAGKVEVLEGPLKGRKLPIISINILNKNAIAQKIGQAELAEFVKAVKLPAIPRDTAEFLYRPFTADIDIKPPEVDPQTKQPKINPKNGKPFTAQNVIAKYMLYGGQDVPVTAKSSGGGGSAAAASGQQSSSAPTTRGRRPWEN